MAVRGSGGGFLVSHFEREGMEIKGINCMLLKKENTCFFFEKWGLED